MTASKTPAPWSAQQRDSFAFESTQNRWPIILKGVVTDIQGVAGVSADHQLREEGAHVMERVERLADDIAVRKELEDLKDDGNAPPVSIYNRELARLRPLNQSSWATGPWLFNECYLYRLLRSFFASTSHWTFFDPFRAQKIATFASSAAGVLQLVELAATFDNIHDKPDSEIAQANFFELVQCGLWANATDLSLLTSLSHEDIIKLQSGNTASKMSNILKNDSAPLWQHFRKLRDGRVDIVFDNSGFEVFADLIFADWMVTKTPYVKKVVFHPKTIPWFVSDVITHIDIDDMFVGLDDMKNGLTDYQRGLFEDLTSRWRSYFASGIFHLTTPSPSNIGANVPLANFWCGPFEFPRMPREDPELLEELQKSDLVLFKGDLNYRKLTSDAQWPADTPMEVALGDLKGKFPIVSLRTCKADVVVGLKPGQAEEMDDQDPKWRVNGKWALITYVPRDEA